MVHTVIYHTLKAGSIVTGATLRPVDIFVNHGEAMAAGIFVTCIQLTFDRLLRLTVA